MAVNVRAAAGMAVNVMCASGIAANTRGAGRMAFVPPALGADETDVAGAAYAGLHFGSYVAAP